ncbi:Ww domain-containing oxidoreductase, partial [Globisporangium splendens]
MGNSNSPAAVKTQVPENWDTRKIPSLTGKTAIVTGANSGIGYEMALELARKGANVVLACRSEERGKHAETRIRESLAKNPAAGKVEFAKLDVSSLKSVQEFADEFTSTHTRLDILVNNAGILAAGYDVTVDGYESQFAINHLGQFALTAHLFDVLKKSAPCRIVNVSSVAHHDAKFDEDNIVKTSVKKYDAWTVYGDSKLCNILFTKELDRRIKVAGIVGVTAAVSHPGLTESNIFATFGTEGRFSERLKTKMFKWFSLFQTAPMGALPTLYAATALNVQGGDYFGPKGFMKLSGYPTLEEPSKISESKSAAKKLWTLSERLAHLSFDVKK